MRVSLRAVALLPNSVKKNGYVDNCKHIAIVYHGRTVVAIGYNRWEMNGKSLHAEVDAIQKAQEKILKGIVKVKRFSMLVLRCEVRKNGTIHYSMSKPCERCQKYLALQNCVRKTYWTVDDCHIDHCNVNMFEKND